MLLNYEVVISFGVSAVISFVVSLGMLLACAARAGRLRARCDVNGPRAPCVPCAPRAPLLHHILPPPPPSEKTPLT